MSRVSNFPVYNILPYQSVGQPMNRSRSTLAIMCTLHQETTFFFFYKPLLLARNPSTQFPIQDLEV
jgi:hypothetical protein